MGEPADAIDALLEIVDQRERLRPLLDDLGEGPVEERQDPEWGKRLVTVHPSGLDIEVFFTAGHPLYDREFERRVEIPLEGQPVPFISPEDLVLRKLVNTRKRRGQDWEDARSIARVQGPNLDLAYLREHCAPHRVCDQVEQLAALVEDA